MNMYTKINDSKRTALINMGVEGGAWLRVLNGMKCASQYYLNFSIICWSFLFSPFMFIISTTKDHEEKILIIKLLEALESLNC